MGKAPPHLQLLTARLFVCMQLELQCACIKACWPLAVTHRQQKKLMHTRQPPFLASNDAQQSERWDLIPHSHAGRRSAQEESYAAAASSRRASSTPSQAYDERPAVARGSYAADTAAAASPPAAAAPAPRPLPKPDRAAASASVADPAGAQTSSLLSPSLRGDPCLTLLHS